MKEKKSKIKYISVIVWMFYFMCYVPLINKGIDVTDTGFYLIKYKYLFNDSSRVIDFGIVLTDIIGGVLYNLIPNSQLFFLNILGIFAYCICGVLTWKVLSEYKKSYLIMLGIFASNFLAISFIKTLNYNILSSLFFHCAVYMLLIGMFKNKKILIMSSGILLALNIYVRFPNVLHLAVGMIFILKGLQEGEWRKRFKELFIWCVGIIIGIVLGMTISLIFLDPISIYSTLKDYFSKAGSDTDVRGISYGVKFMLYCMKRGCKSAVVYLIFPITIFFALSRNKKLEKIISVLGVFVSIVCGIVFQMKCIHREPNLCLAYFIIYIVLLVGIVVYIKKDKKLSIISAVGLIISLVGVFGSDTYIQVLSFFSYYPICVTLLVVFKIMEEETIKNYKIIFKMILAFFMSVTLFGGVYMLTTQVYRDEPYEYLTEKVSIEYGPYGRMKTSQEHKNAIQSTKNVLDNFCGEELLFLGDFNAGCVVSDTVPFFSVPWPDLESFKVETFKKELEEKTKRGIYPVILLADKEKFSLRDITEKEIIIKKFIDREKYDIYYHDEYITVYTKE